MGNTIVVSRGLVDVLPNEASLAMVLSRELAHILLGHNLGSKYAFNDRLLFSDESVYRNLGFRHLPEEEAAADKKALELLKSSPYADKLYTPGLFLRQLEVRGRALSALLTPHLGTGFTDRSGDRGSDGGVAGRCSGPRSRQTGSDRSPASGRTRQGQRLG